MKVLLALLLLVPCFLMARDEYMRDDIDPFTIKKVSSNVIEDTMYLYSLDKMELVDMQMDYQKEGGHRWNYLKGKYDAFNQIRLLYETPKN